jgi:hypothetical protein
MEQIVKRDSVTLYLKSQDPRRPVVLCFEISCKEDDPRTDTKRFLRFLVLMIWWIVIARGKESRNQSRALPNVG